MTVRASACVVLALALGGCAGESGTGGGPADRPVFDPGPVPASRAEGADLFLANCTGCHGPAGSGLDGGPPLLDTLYLAPRLADSTIRRAVLAGSPRRHWDFDDMPAVRTVREHQIPALIGYIRWVQGRWDSAGRPGAAGSATPQAGGG